MFYNLYLINFSIKDSLCIWPQIFQVFIMPSVMNRSLALRVASVCLSIGDTDHTVWFICYCERTRTKERYRKVFAVQLGLLLMLVSWLSLKVKQDLLTSLFSDFLCFAMRRKLSNFLVGLLLYVSFQTFSESSNGTASLVSHSSETREQIQEQICWHHCMWVYWSFPSIGNLPS